MWKLGKFAAVVAAAVVLQACAFVDQEIDLMYTAKGYEPAGTGVVVAAEPAAKYLNAVNEKGQLVIGTVKNGFGAHTADVVPLTDPAVWIMDALKAELELAGYSVEQAEGITVDTAPRGIELSVSEIFVDQDTGFATIGAISTLVYRIVVKSGAETVEEIDVIYSADISERSLAGTGSLKAASLKEALEVSLGGVMPRVLTALQSAPTS